MAQDIISTFAAGAGVREGVFVFDTLIGHRVALTVALIDSPNGGENTSETGNRTIAFLGQHSQSQQGEIYRVNVASAQVARQRVAEVFREASREKGPRAGDVVLFIGATDAACQAVLNAIGFKATRGAGPQ